MNNRPRTTTGAIYDFLTKVIPSGVTAATGAMVYSVKENVRQLAHTAKDDPEGIIHKINDNVKDNAAKILDAVGLSLFAHDDLIALKNLYDSWHYLTSSQRAIMTTYLILCHAAPGYALYNLVDKNHNSNEQHILPTTAALSTSQLALVSGDQAITALKNHNIKKGLFGETLPLLTTNNRETVSTHRTTYSR